MLNQGKISLHKRKVQRRRKRILRKKPAGKKSNEPGVQHRAFLIDKGNKKAGEKDFETPDLNGDILLVSF